MPWTVSDVDEHKKGLTPAQKAKWVSVANGIYKACLAKGGTDKTCAPKAIRIANSKFSEVVMKETKKISKAALCFSEANSLAKVESFAEGEKSKLSMIAYSGKIIKDHWYWGDLAIDTAGVILSENNIPILHDHNTSEKIGFGKFIVNDRHEIVPEDSTFVDTPIAQEFIKLSREGFPYQASIQARPMQILKLEEGETCEVNGFTMTGPGTVWRKSVLKECSVTTFGADSNTKSVAMSENEEVEVEIQGSFKSSKEENIMTLDEFKAAHPDLYSQVIAEGKAEAETAFTAIKTDLENKITVLSAEKQTLTSLNAETETRLRKVEKVMEIQKEEGIKSSAETVFAEIMAKHEIPDRLRSKIRKQINHESFVSDEKLDVVAFSEAIETELKDWVNVEGTSEPSILGMSFTKTAPQDTADAMVARMLKHVGQEVKH
jgi:hypothetical protein